MKTENRLRFMSLVFSSYGFLITFMIAYLNFRKGGPLSSLEISGLFSAALAILFGTLADLVSMK